jgi:hypothetical protein
VAVIRRKLLVLALGGTLGFSASGALMALGASGPASFLAALVLCGWLGWTTSDWVYGETP